MKVFYPEGGLRGTAYFKQGVRHGAAVTYYKEGTKAEEVNYADGKIIGEFEQALREEKDARLEDTREFNDKLLGVYGEVKPLLDSLKDLLRRVEVELGRIQK